MRQRLLGVAEQQRERAGMQLQQSQQRLQQLQQQELQLAGEITAMRTHVARTKADMVELVKKTNRLKELCYKQVLIMVPSEDTDWRSPAINRYWAWFLQQALAGGILQLTGIGDCSFSRHWLEEPCNKKVLGMVPSAGIGWRSPAINRYWAWFHQQALAAGALQ